MHRIRCFAEGGFKINGPPRVDKGPMSNEKDQSKNNETSLPQPTQAGRIELCTELIVQAMRCLENNDKQCVTRLIEELIKANCHNGNAVGKKIADGVRELVHELWLRSDDELRCKLLRLLVELGVSRNWFRSVFNTNTKMLNKWLGRCGIARETRNNIVKQLEDLLRRMGWNEIKMCEELWRFVGVDVNVSRKYGIEPCVWLEGLESLRDLGRPYWLGLRASDLATGKLNDKIALEIGTTNSIDAVFFPVLLGMVKTPSPKIWRKRKVPPTVKYVSRPIALTYYVYLSADAWPWPIELDINELERILNNLSNEELAMFIAGLLDGDGAVWYDGKYAFTAITACKDCPKRFILDVLKKVIAKKFGIVGSIKSYETKDALVFCGEDAVKLPRLIRPFVHHPLRRLRIELILALYDGRISPEEFEELYETTEYERGAPDIKRNHALEALARTAPQTHTHGEQTTHKKELKAGAGAGIRTREKRVCSPLQVPTVSPVGIALDLSATPAS